MITITSERGLEHIDSREDVATRPGFVRDVDPEAVALDAIVGNYQEAEPVRCGLSTCRQPHGRGYLGLALELEAALMREHGSPHFTLAVRFGESRRHSAAAAAGSRADTAPPSQVYNGAGVSLRQLVEAESGSSLGEADTACFEQRIAYFETSLPHTRRLANVWAQGFVDELVAQLRQCQHVRSARS